MGFRLGILYWILHSSFLAFLGKMAGKAVVDFFPMGLISNTITIQKSGERAAAVVQDLLTLARRDVFSTQILNLNQVLSGILESPEFPKLVADYPDTRIETDLQPDLFDVHGSQIHLSKAIMNLLYNAMEAMKGVGQLTISTSNRYIDQPTSNYDVLAEGEYVALRISDNGEGIREMGESGKTFYSNGY